MQLSLYLHFPFCSNKCSYCDFYKELYERSLEKEFFHALRIETELIGDDPAVQNAEIVSIFVGGGTPSLMDLDLFADWLSLLKRQFQVPEHIEFTIEANPESVTVERLQVLKELGVNRPVFGTQSFNTRLLELLGRRHNPYHSQRAVYLAHALDFRNFGVDLIFGLPGQTSRMLSDDLDQILDLEPPHISFYQLTVEDGTPLAGQVASGEVQMPSPELSLAMYRGGSERMIEAGYHRYEVSSFAKPGHACQHNLRYWEGGDFLGLGPSAHSFLDGRRFANTSNLGEYIRSLQSGMLPRFVDESGHEERMTEAIMLGLRTAQGISRSAFAQRFGVPLEERFDREQYNILVETGHLIPDRGTLRLSEEGIYLADEITRRLVK